jgi:hypothetical protein
MPRAVLFAALLLLLGVVAPRARFAADAAEMVKTGSNFIVVCVRRALMPPLAACGMAVLARIRSSLSATSPSDLPRGRCTSQQHCPVRFCSWRVE